MTLDEITSVIDEVDEMISGWSERYGMDFSPSFNVTGGEPFLRPDLFNILSVIRRRGFSVYLLTNGTLITADNAARLADLTVQGVQVSIEGPEEIHDAIRGAGSFRRSVAGVKMLLNHGLRVTLNATLSEINAGSFQDIMKLASLLGVQRLGFSRLVPSGRGRELIRQSLGSDTVRRLYEDIFSADPGGVEIVTGDPVASQMSCSPDASGEPSETPTGGCAAGISGLTLLSDGTITPCRRMPVPLGNVKTDSLREVWATSEVLEMLRDRSQYKGRCGACSRWSICRGCRAIAYAWSQAMGEGDLLADDPQCFIGR